MNDDLAPRETGARIANRRRIRIGFTRFLGFWFTFTYSLSSYFFVHRLLRLPNMGIAIFLTFKVNSNTSVSSADRDIITPKLNIIR